MWFSLVLFFLQCFDTALLVGSLDP